MAVTDETEAKVREDREAAVAYGQAVLAGEEPWNDDAGDEGDPDDGVADPIGPRNDDVGENGSDSGPFFLDVNQDEPAPEPED